MENLAYYIFTSDLENAKLILANGADINMKYGDAEIYPICSAINSDNPETLRFIIKNGADVNIKNGLPLHEALDLAIDGMIQNNLTQPYSDSIEMIKILLENEADLEIEDEHNERPIDILHKYSGGQEEELEKLKFLFRPIIPNIDVLLEKRNKINK